MMVLMPNLLREGISAIRLSYVKRFASFVLSLSGYSVLFWADWRVALGVWLLQWGGNVYRSIGS
jgi:hypothetical protein